MLQNNIFMLSKPISFFLKTTLYLLHSKVPYFIFKRYIFYLRNKGLLNFQLSRFSQEIDNHPDLFRGQFPLPFAEADSF